MGWEYRWGAKVPANHSLTTGKVLASRKPKKLQFRRQRPQRSRIGAASATQPPAEFLSPHHHLDGNAVLMRRILIFVEMQQKQRIAIVSPRPSTRSLRERGEDACRGIDKKPRAERRRNSAIGTERTSQRALTQEASQGNNR